MSRTLVVTNDFPTRQGGIETFVLSLVRQLAPDDVVVYTASMSGDAALDATLPFSVVRDPSTTLLPTPRVARRAREVVRAHDVSTVLFGSSVPLGLLAPDLRASGATRLVAITHGHECWWARVPGTRQALRRIGESTDCLTYLGAYTRSVISRALSPAAAARMVALTPGVDPDVFVPATANADGRGTVRARYNLGPDQPVILCVGRLTARKGQDMLVRAMPTVLAAVPDAALLLVGGGAYRSSLERLADRTGVASNVRFAGPVRWADTPAFFAAGDVFAGPSRTRLGGLEPEAFGIVFLEAQSCGLPVLVGDSGGAPDTVRHGETGYVVDPGSPDVVAERLVELLTDRARASAMGAAGRDWVRRDWTWDRAGVRLRAILAG